MSRQSILANAFIQDYLKNAPVGDEAVSAVSRAGGSVSGRVRISVGIEDLDDLIGDLDEALSQV